MRWPSLDQVLSSSKVRGLIMLTFRSKCPSAGTKAHHCPETLQSPQFLDEYLVLLGTISSLVTLAFQIVLDEVLPFWLHWRTRHLRLIQPIRAFVLIIPFTHDSNQQNQDYQNSDSYYYYYYSRTVIIIICRVHSFLSDRAYDRTSRLFSERGEGQKQDPRPWCSQAMQLIEDNVDELMEITT